MRRIRTLILTLSIVLQASATHAEAYLHQTAPPAEKTEFEVVSIKPNVSGGGGGTGMLRPEPGGRLTAEGVLLRFFIQSAYGVKSYQISGGPGWIDSDRF